MKAKHLAITILFFIGTLSIQAQRGERPDPKAQAKANVEAWTKALKLTEDQQKKAYEVILASNDKRTKAFAELRENGGGREEMTAAFTKMQEDTDKELKKIFTEAQWPLYEKWKKENSQRQRGGNRGGNRGGE